MYIGKTGKGTMEDDNYRNGKFGTYTTRFSLKGTMEDDIITVMVNSVLYPLFALILTMLVARVGSHRMLYFWASLTQ
jgi:hypothetical protein